MTITAFTLDRRVIINTVSSFDFLRIERKERNDADWSVFTGSGFEVPSSGTTISFVKTGDFLDNFNLSNGIYQYRVCNSELENPTDNDYLYSKYVMINVADGVGYTFGNYRAPQGNWGTAVTTDDIRMTYLWGTDFKATNGQSFTDEQIQYFIDASTDELARMLDVTIKKKRIRNKAAERGLVKGDDYDVDEAPYDFKFSRISRYGMIKTRQRPILKLHKLTLLSRLSSAKDFTKTTIVDGSKGILKLMERPIKPSETSSGIQTAIGMYGNQTMEAHLFYAIDYDAGYENSDEIPSDLRQIIGKHAAVSMLNIIGDGLMSGFSSSSLSMDGISESFSSTQSATSAYFGARIKEYKEDIDNYIKANKNKFSNMAIGSI